MSPRRGEVWLADLGWEGKVRPVVIVSREDPDPPRSLVIYVPLTTQNRGSDYEVPIPKVRFLDRNSVANVQGLGSVATVRLGRKLGTLPGETIAAIENAVLWALALQQAAEEPQPELTAEAEVVGQAPRMDDDLELLLPWFHDVCREDGHHELVRDLIRRAHLLYIDGYSAPGDEDEIDDDVTDEEGVSRAFARLEERWDELERDWIAMEREDQSDNRDDSD